MRNACNIGHGLTFLRFFKIIPENVFEKLGINAIVIHNVII